MYANIKITAPKFNIGAFEHKLNRSMIKIGREGRDFWRTLAGQRLKSSRVAYQRSVKVFKDSPTSVSLGLDGTSWIANAVEEGRPPYSMTIHKNHGIAPLNLKRVIRFNNPTVFAKQGGKPWQHPGFENPLNLRDEVAEEVKTIAIRYIEEALDEL